MIEISLHDFQMDGAPSGHLTAARGVSTTSIPIRSPVQGGYSGATAKIAQAQDHTKKEWKDTCERIFNTTDLPDEEVWRRQPQPSSKLWSCYRLPFIQTTQTGAEHHLRNKKHSLEVSKRAKKHFWVAALLALRRLSQDRPSAGETDQHPSTTLVTHTLTWQFPSPVLSVPTEEERADLIPDFLFNILSSTHI